MPKATQRKDFRWMIQLPRVAGKPRQCVYGRTEAEAQVNYLRAIGAGEATVRPGSIAEFMVLHFAEWLAPRVSELSFERYDVNWRGQLGPAVGHLLFSELTPARVQEALSACGSPSNQELSKSLLAQMVKLAIALKLAGPDTLMMVTLARLDPRAPKERVDIMKRGDAVIAASLGTDWEAVIWLQKSLGLRWGEVCGLKRTDLQGNTLTVQRQRNNKVGEVPYTKKRKPGEHRVIGLPPQMAAILRGYMNGELYAFHGPDGMPIDYCHNDRKLKPILKAAGVESWTMHDFRSYAIVNLYGRVDEKTYYNLFGHRAIQQTRQYLDSSEDQTREALELLVQVDA